MKKSILTLLAGASLVAGGCYSINTIQSTETTAQIKQVSDKRIIWDNTLNGKIDIGTLIETNIGGLRKIQVPVSNRYAYQQDFVYQFVWVDQNGMTIDNKNSWHRLHLEAHESSTFAEIAPSLNAHDFILKLQETKHNQAVF
jgi:uncharacterized protein YcfL